MILLYINNIAETWRALLAECYKANELKVKRMGTMSVHSLNNNNNSNKNARFNCKSNVYIRATATVIKRKEYYTIQNRGWYFKQRCDKNRLFCDHFETKKCDTIMLA